MTHSNQAMAPIRKLPVWGSSSQLLMELFHFGIVLTFAYPGSTLHLVAKAAAIVPLDGSDIVNPEAASRSRCLPSWYTATAIASGAVLTDVTLETGMQYRHAVGDCVPTTNTEPGARTL